MKRFALPALGLTFLLILPGWIGWTIPDPVVQAASLPLSGLLFLKALAGLIGAPSMLAFLLFSRIDEDQTLRHATRARILSLVRQEPGLGLSAIQQRLGLGWGTVVYHLNRMEAARLVSSSPVGRRRAFFLAGQTRGDRATISLLDNGAHVRLLHAVQARRGATQQDVARAAGLSLPLANRYLQRLEASGLVVSQKTWRVRRYEATPALDAQLAVFAQRRSSPDPADPTPLSAERGTNAT
jgi:predicted transcriptional regulator